MASSLPKTRIESVDRFVREACAHGGDRPFFESAEADGTKLTFREFDERISRAAGVYSTLGIGPNTAVSLFLRNSPDFFPAWLGAIRAGAVVNPINLGLERTPERVVYMLKKAKAKLLVMERSFVQLAAEVKTAYPSLPIVFVDGTPPESRVFSKIDWQRHLQKADATFPEVPAKPGDAFQMIFTSGTTGLPKAVVQRHEMVMDAFSIAENFELSGADTCVCVLPFFHVNAQYTSFFPMLGVGGRMILFEKFSATRFWPVIEQAKATYVSVVPSLLTRLLAAGLPHTGGRGAGGPPQGADKKAWASLRFIICGAAPLAADLHKEFIDKTGIPVANGWGMTETGCWGCQMRPAKITHGAMGYPLPINEMKVADPATGQEFPRGETGMLLIRGPNVFDEYFDAEEATQKAFRFGDGWFDTGDDARVDADGQYWFVGRGSVDTGKVDGEFVNYLTIDEKLWSLPGIREICCVGVPDAIRGNVVAACVVKADGATLTADDVTAWAKKQGLASWELPRHVLFVEEVPKGDTGKIQRRVMAERAAALLAPQG